MITSEFVAGAEVVDVALALIHNGDSAWDWYCIERAVHDGREWLEHDGPNSSEFMRSARISDADVEGPLAEMLGIADAIEKRTSFHARRCAVVTGEDWVEFWSPRNSRYRARVPLAVADAFAIEVRNEVSRLR